VDQFNLPVPETVREGCAVPFQVRLEIESISQPVTIAVRTGGGACVDTPAAGYGQITWEKTVSTTAAHVATEADTVTVSLQASPGKQAPPVPVFTEGPLAAVSTAYFGSSCPVPGYRSLGAGTVTAQGPGFAPVTASVSPLQRQQVAGLTVYQAALPAGTIESGKFTVAASGGPDVGEFQSSIQIAPEIQITTDLAGTAFCNQPVTINWTGGDPTSWVTVSQVLHAGTYDGYHSWQARVSDGTLTIPAPPGWLCSVLQCDLLASAD
jgi:hypothetical protein